MSGYLVSKKIYDIAKSSWFLKHVAVFCAAHLVWIMFGFTIAYYYNKQLILILLVFVPWGISVLISETVRRKRPYELHEFKPLVVPFVNTPSFPSAHSTIAFTLLSYFVSDVNLFVPFLICAALVALGRVAVGVHYLSDIFAGALIGFFLGLALQIGTIIF